MRQTSDFRRPQENHQPIVVAFRGIHRRNEKKISHRWREQAWIAMDVSS